VAPKPDPEGSITSVELRSGHLPLINIELLPKRRDLKEEISSRACRCTDVETRIRRARSMVSVLPSGSGIVNVHGADEVFADQCVQQRLACSVGVSPTGAEVRSPVAWIAGRRETK
jgi:hypothetical protein